MMALRAAALAALVLVPAFAFDGGTSGARASRGAVAANEAAYVQLTNLAPLASDPLVLERRSGFEADALTARNGFVAGSRLALHASLAPGGERFRIPNPDAVLAAGATHTFRIEDQAPRHERVCTPVTILLRATILDADGSRRGAYADEETVHIRVGARC